MANHKSAVKRTRQTIRKAKINNDIRTTVRTFEKKLRVAIAAGDKTKAGELFRTYESKLGKATQKGILKMNTMARKISRLASQIHKLG